jgi:hypothetical protein
LVRSSQTLHVLFTVHDQPARTIHRDFKISPRVNNFTDGNLFDTFDLHAADPDRYLPNLFADRCKRSFYPNPFLHFRFRLHP